MTKKKILSLLLAAALIVSLFCTFSVSAYAAPASADASLSLSQSFTFTANHPPQAGDAGLTVTYGLTPAGGQDGSIDRTSLTLNGNQTGTFNFSFNHAGEYVYTLRPQTQTRQFYTYDDTAYTVRVYVRNLADGSLFPVVTIWNADNTEKISSHDENADLSYEHRYNLVIVPLTIDDADDPIGQKVISGDTPDEETTFDFTFRTVSMNALNITAQPMPAAAGNQPSMVVSRQGAGSVSVGSLTFTEPGTYVYQLSENNGGVAGYQYDTRIYYVTFVVTLNGAALNATRTITLNGETVDVAEFNNQYTAPEPIPEEETPQAEPEEIPEEEVPLADNSAWALVNLILTVLTIGAGGGMTYSYAKKKGETEDKEEQKKLATKLLGWVPAIGSVVAFVLTEDMRAPMTIVDKWTILMAAILASSGATAYLTRSKKKEETPTASV